MQLCLGCVPTGLFMGKMCPHFSCSLGLTPPLMWNHGGDVIKGKMMTDNSCLMPGEMGRTPPDLICAQPSIPTRGNSGNHDSGKIIHGPGTYITREGGTAVVKEFIESEGFWEGTYTFEDTSYDYFWFPCGRSHSDGPDDRDIVKIDDRGSQGVIGHTGLDENAVKCVRCGGNGCRECRGVGFVNIDKKSPWDALPAGQVPPSNNSHEDLLTCAYCGARFRGPAFLFKDEGGGLFCSATCYSGGHLLTMTQIEEIDRRVKEFEKDPSKAISWDEVKRRILGKLYGAGPKVTGIVNSTSKIFGQGKTADELITMGGGVNMLKDRKLSINVGHTPPKSPSVTVEEDDEPRNVGSIEEAVKACGSFMELDGTLASAIKAISMRCGAAEKQVKELTEKSVEPPVTQAQPPNTTRLVIDIPNDLSRRIVDVAQMVGLDTKQIIRMALYSYVR